MEHSVAVRAKQGQVRQFRFSLLGQGEWQYMVSFKDAFSELGLRRENIADFAYRATLPVFAFL